MATAHPTGSDRQSLLSVLDAIGKSAATLSDTSGRSVVVLPYGGRVLGLYSDAGSPNFFWTNPALAQPESAMNLFESAGWHNTGGDRTWLAPELDFFFPRFPDTSIYSQPRQLDAGMYAVGECATEIHLTTKLLIRSFRSGAEFSVSLSKTISLAADPLARLRKSEPLEDLRFAGYRLQTKLALQDSPREGEWIGIWNLLQLPGGGEFSAPTYWRAEPTVFFGEVPDDDLRCEERMIRYRMQVRGEQKICIPATATTGRMGYCFSNAGERALVVRSFVVDPAGAYVDVWHTRPTDDGYAVQACNVNSESLGCFAEMEYHAPAVGASTFCRCCEDTSLVWAYWGEPSAIHRAAELLLGRQTSDESTA